MSTALRIASVTQVLKDLLNNGLIDHDVTGSIGGNVNVTSWPPDKIETSADKELSQLNLFMYQATYNPGWRNVNLPSFNPNGERIKNNPLAIDLHYLLTAYGSTELHTDILLGYGMQLFHEVPVLNRSAIRRAIGPPSLLPGSPPVTPLPPSLRLLSNSLLAEQVEQIKITPEVMSIEDISKLWAAFGTKYRPTAAYKATVVLIESSKSTKTSLPVKARNIYVKPFKQPFIEKILSQATVDHPVLEDQKILSGYKLFLRGYELANGTEPVDINIDGAPVATIPATGVTNTEISFDIPMGISAGVHEIQVAHKIAMGSPPIPYTGVLSQAEAFMLSPKITQGSVSPTVGSGSIKSGKIDLTVNPLVNTGQRVMMLMNEMINNNPTAYSFPLSASVTLPSANLSFDISGVKGNTTYLIRVQVDGAESPLDIDAQGKYNGPVVNIPA